MATEGPKIVRTLFVNPQLDPPELIIDVCFMQRASEEPEISSFAIVCSRGGGVAARDCHSVGDGLVSHPPSLQRSSPTRIQCPPNHHSNSLNSTSHTLYIRLLRTLPIFPSITSQREEEKSIEAWTDTSHSRPSAPYLGPYLALLATLIKIPHPRSSTQSKLQFTPLSPPLSHVERKRKYQRLQAPQSRRQQGRIRSPDPGRSNSHSRSHAKCFQYGFLLLHGAS